MKARTMLAAACAMFAMAVAAQGPQGRGRGDFDVEFLSGLIAIPSITPDVAANNRAVEYVRAWCARHGLFTVVETNEVGRAGLYVSTTPGRRHDIVFVTHVDVVPPSAEGQFEPSIKGDFLYGRGACDTKGNVAAILHALAKNAGRGSFGAVVATDEENRYPGQDTPTLLLDHGVVPQKFIIVGDTNGEHIDSLTTAEKGHVAITMRARGRGGHSSMPWAADNPIPRLTEAYVKLRAALPSPADPDDHWRDDLTPTRISGSQANNIIPDVAEMVFSFRFTTPDAPQRMKEFIERTTGLEVSLPATWRPPVVTDPENPYVKSLFATMRRQWPDKNIRFTKMSCATDATRYAHLKLPTVVFGATGYGAHAKDERVSLSSVIGYARMFAEFLESQAK